LEARQEPDASGKAMYTWVSHPKAPSSTSSKKH